jgi:hypothetical protein
MGETAVGKPRTKAGPRGLAAFVHVSIARARMVAVPYRLGDVVVGDEPFKGCREGVVVVKNGTFVGLQTADGLVFYDHRQLRLPD